MLINNDYVTLGRDGAGLYIPGVITIGGNSSTAELVIDMTSETLNGRVSYVGPPHFFWSADGTLQKSASVTTWPLEYRNGVAVGRHEPEPQATNYQGGSLISAITSDFVATSTAVAETLTGPTGADVVALRSDFLKTALYANGEWLIAEYYPGITDQYQRVIMSGELPSAAQVRTYIGRWDSSNYCYALSQEIPAGP
ncbi:hypothetical protein EHW66_21690, partial [Erwinia psidii]|uniref:hypothetical protein n=1 Tax=Erwinia psidii TaxID=69224 RepID=UPI00226B0645